VTFDQSGTGQLRLTSTFLLSGVGANKTMVTAASRFSAGLPG
jgi:hypothetical protein